MKSSAGKSPWLVYLPVFCLCLSTLVYSQIRGGRWQHLGSAHVDGRSDHDKIEVGGGGTFTALQMAVTNGAVGFERITVHFRNGGEEVLPVAAVVRSGGHTPPIPCGAELEKSAMSKSGMPRANLRASHESTYSEDGDVLAASAHVSTRQDGRVP